MSHRSLNLDTGFSPTGLEGIHFNSRIFSGGEIHVNLDNNVNYKNVESVIITHRVNSSADLMLILMAKDALERKGVKGFSLVMPYIPYARQDRVCVEGESFTLKVFASILNTAKFDAVFTLDAHSDVASALIDNCYNACNTKYVEQAVEYIAEHFDADIALISPDSGSNKKANKLYKDVSILHNLVKCDKSRDLLTGDITGFEVFADDLKGQTCLIVDDICDGGRTFLGIAKELKKCNSGPVYLFVTHGIFSNGFDSLLEEFDEIFCTDSVRNIDNKRVHQFKCKDYGR